MQSDTHMTGSSDRTALGMFALVAAAEVIWLAALLWLASRS
jgi:hypothetical protein